MVAIAFAPWDALLKQYVDEQGRVDYRTWQRDQPDSLNQWLSTFQSPDFSLELPRDQQLALWINLYNAFTIARILERYPIPSIQPKILGLPNWAAFLWFFSRPAHVVAGKRYSLADIEHKVLRSQFQEPRIHFALVCASIGCPLLRNEAYWPDRVEQQLEADVSRFINNEDKVYYDSKTQTLYCSQIFKWYRQDFLQVAPSIPDYIRRYLKVDRPLDAETPIQYLDYDWQLNQRISA
ncbi:DUF547 domain-containing protein [Trichocoleus sp. FACHB-591]|uniref:DUF547 domain-containing protein n=1 Tax=Trichocoleus sp. FACHB-591 TaxID=2692872 RepID=UPI0016846D59|nr:DUF547 domain-containing protein [Trichocoleus sp. FACHB-591]MBD2093987.1 DUF547 domain-containing protein [Trichocoleus sp. FACHB-591]